VKKPELFKFEEPSSSSRTVSFNKYDSSDEEDDNEEEGDNDDQEDVIMINNKPIIKPNVSNVKRKSTQFIPSPGSFMGVYKCCH